MRILTILALVVLIAQPAFAADNEKEAVYERVMRTGEIRCGYALWAPALMMDPNTGELSGIFYDYVEALGDLLDLKIVWSGEVNMQTYIQDLNNGKYDLECSGGWPNAYRGKFADYTTPIFFTPTYLYAKAGDMRFDDNVDSANDPSVRFSTMPGDSSEQIREIRFPNSMDVSVDPNSPLVYILDQIRYGKADVTLMDALSSEPYIEQHPDSLRRVVSGPLRITANNMTVPAGEYRFRDMLDIATRQLLYDGVIDRILEKHDIPEDHALRVQPPYRMPENTD
ncbi:MAG: transporter substrate-binding domain-containing protein [Alphaproteobacteria bacterium]|nr:transporter substrate-binding domain-containing protein [Alphaproteobacteria bacterium]